MCVIETNVLVWNSLTRHESLNFHSLVVLSLKIIKSIHAKKPYNAKKADQKKAFREIKQEINCVLNDFTTDKIGIMLEAIYICTFLRVYITILNACQNKLVKLAHTL